MITLVTFFCETKIELRHLPLQAKLTPEYQNLLHSSSDHQEEMKRKRVCHMPTRKYLLICFYLISSIFQATQKF
jgi:hypothetical protein